jgi:hypothetical protein
MRHLLPGSPLLAIATCAAWVQPAIAQLPDCQPPRPEEYLLLVVSETPESQQRVRRILPEDLDSQVCTYLDDTVTRVGGFRRENDAKAWAEHVMQETDLSAFVAGAATALTPVRGEPQRPEPDESNRDRAAASGYAPQRLDAGYAVLVDYFQDPDIADRVADLTGEDVGLAAYGDKHYLLVEYTTDESDANTLLRRLSDRGFWVMVVDSRRVVQLAPRVGIGD